MIIKKIRPMFTSLITPMDTYKADVMNEFGLIESNKTVGNLKEYQKVIAVGPNVKNIEVGDIVCINPKRYGIVKHNDGSLKDGVIEDNPVVKYNFNVVNIDGKNCLLLEDRDIDFVVEEYELD